jgi:hypothetical protein
MSIFLSLAFKMLAIILGFPKAFGYGISLRIHLLSLLSPSSLCSDVAVSFTSIQQLVISLLCECKSHLRHESH